MSDWIVGIFLLPDFQMFLNLKGVEKPVLGRGLNSLIAGASGQEGRKAADMLSSFQAKRTRVGKGLGAFLKGQQKLTDSESTGAPLPAASTAPERTTGEPQPAPTISNPTPAAAPISENRPTSMVSSTRVLRVKRQPRSGSTGGGGEQRQARSLRTPGRPVATEAVASVAAPISPVSTVANSSHEPAVEEKKTAAPAIEEPAFQKPFIQERPAYLRRKPVAEPQKGDPKVAVSPNFRMTLLIIDWVIIAGCFAVAWNLEPGRHLTLALCALGVVGGAVLGAWALSLEPEDIQEDRPRF